MISGCHVISQDHVIEGSLYGQEPIKVSLAKCRGHRHFGSEDIMILVCYAILQDHVIKVM